jgi:outer membrane protein assembly factor BamB
MALREDGAMQGPCLSGYFGPELVVAGGGEVLLRSSADSGGEITRFHPRRGADRVPVPRGVWSLAADRSGRVFFLQVDRTLGAVDGAGSLLWSIAGSGRRPWSGLTAGEEGAFVTATDGLHAFDAGVERWHLAERAAPVPPVLGDDGLVYWVGWADGAYEVLGVSVLDGQPASRAPLPPEVEPRDVTVGRGGEVYVRCADGRVRVHRAGGEYCRTVDARAAGRAVVGQDGTAYVPGADGILRALDPEGEVRWSLQVSERTPCLPPAIGGDGTVYVTTADGRCVAIE